MILPREKLGRKTRKHVPTNDELRESFEIHRVKIGNRLQ